MTDARGLLATTDATVWAEEFCRIFNRHMVTDTVTRPPTKYERPLVDPGTMVAWFANAIEVGRAVGRKETCPHAPEDMFAIADDLSSCRKCGEIFVEPSNG